MKGPQSTDTKRRVKMGESGRPGNSFRYARSEVKRGIIAEMGRVMRVVHAIDCFCFSLPFLCTFRDVSVRWRREVHYVISHACIQHKLGDLQDIKDHDAHLM